MRSVQLVVLLCFCACSVPESQVTRTGDSAEPVAVEAKPKLTPNQVTPWVEIGRTVQGRPINKHVVGSGARRVLWVGGIHGNEREGSVATAMLADAFGRDSDLGLNVILTIVEDINPDGSANNTRGNAHGVDLNRNFPAKNALPRTHPLSEPESRVLHDLILELQPHTVIVAHSWGIKPKGPSQFINYDGPGRPLADVFSVLSGYVVVESNRINTTPGSLGSWVGVDMQVPIYTIEYQRGRDPETVWLETREGILALIGG